MGGALGARFSSLVMTASSWAKPARAAAAAASRTSASRATAKRATTPERNTQNMCQRKASDLL